jgi:preprotein translocase subunit SecG
VTLIIVIIQVIVSLFLIMLVLLHAGRGGGLSDMFGGNVGGSMAGSTVMEKNLDRATIIAGLIFIFSTILLAMRLQ